MTIHVKYITQYTQQEFQYKQTTTTKSCYTKALLKHGLRMFYSGRIQLAFKILAVLKKEIFDMEWMWKWIITKYFLTMDYWSSFSYSYILGIILYYSLEKKEILQLNLLIWSSPLSWFGWTEKLTKQFYPEGLSGLTTWFMNRRGCLLF